jgi:hypothetical protein
VLISLSHKFVFVANVKTASSSIEDALSRQSQVAIRQTQFGKHDTLSMISKKFSWVRRYVPYNDFLVFGVVRDPVDWLLSLYNSHTKPDFDGLPYSTKDVPFGRFLREGVETRWQLRRQQLRFSDEHGRFRTNHIIDFADLQNEIPLLCKHLGVEPFALRKLNVSPQALTADRLDPADVEFIRDWYASDYEFLRERPRAF